MEGERGGKGEGGRKRGKENEEIDFKYQIPIFLMHRSIDAGR